MSWSTSDWRIRAEAITTNGWLQVSTRAEENHCNNVLILSGFDQRNSSCRRCGLERLTGENKANTCKQSKQNKQSKQARNHFPPALSYLRKSSILAFNNNHLTSKKNFLLQPLLLKKTHPRLFNHHLSLWISRLEAVDALTVSFFAHDLCNSNICSFVTVPYDFGAFASHRSVVCACLAACKGVLVVLADRNSVVGFYFTVLYYHCPVAFNGTMCTFD